jgi:hypothetical protein
LIGFSNGDLWRYFKIEPKIFAGFQARGNFQDWQLTKFHEATWK